MTITLPAPKRLNPDAQYKQLQRKLKADRLWRHWLYWLDPAPFGPDLRLIPNYDPEPYRGAFEKFQTSGRKGLTQQEIVGIHPLIAAQKAKEITLTSLAEESMQWWAEGWGWIHPWNHTINTRRADQKPMDQLTYNAIIQTMKSIAADPHGFFERHPGISDELKQRYFELRFRTITQHRQTNCSKATP